MAKETENVCNMPTILNFTVHKSKDTDKLYLNLISYSDKIKMSKGKWLSKEISEDDFNEIVKIINKRRRK